MFKTGDIVRLKSGGPKMTVQRLVGDKSSPMMAFVDQHLRTKGHQDGDVICQWFASSELKSETFFVDTLEAVVAESN
ncbi:MAG: DUF2158 domain-containing protein [Opitutae bacterium]|nr:DUF2158 domain-containing protein [Opitutae bacterium]